MMQRVNTAHNNASQSGPSISTINQPDRSYDRLRKHKGDEVYWPPKHAQKGIDRFFVVAGDGMADKWRKDRSIPIIDVVEHWEVFVRRGDVKNGQPGRPTNAELLEHFGTANVDSVIEMILDQGQVIHGEKFVP